MDRIRDALEKLDLIFFTPIEVSDCIMIPAVQDKKLRIDVDKKLQELLFEDSLEMLGETEAVEVSGSFENRVKVGKNAISKN